VLHKIESVGKMNVHGGRGFQLTRFTLNSKLPDWTQESVASFQLKYPKRRLILVSSEYNGPTQLSRCSDSLRAGRSGIRIPLGTRFAVPVQTVPADHQISRTVGTQSLPRVMRPGRGVNHPQPSSAEVKVRVEL
jgi:hypothetical protein